MTPERPADLRLTDLRHPAFAPDVDAMLRGADELGAEVVLEPDALIEIAAAQSGLDDLADGPRWREPLAVLCGALDREADLAPRGRVAVQAQMVQFIVNRLRYVDLLKRHPEIREQEVTAPIIIAGLPRTGTTHLHNLLAADPALRHLPWWEAVEPFPDPREPGPERGHRGGEVDETDPRIARTKAALALQDRVVPHLQRMHEMTWDHAHEEIHLLALAGSSMYFETMAVMPSWREWYTTTDQTPYYEELRTVLAALEWCRPGVAGEGPGRWVLKTPQHVEQLPAIAAAFPDAAVVVTHRDPMAVTASMGTMLAYLGRLNHDVVPVERIAAYWADRLEEMLRSCVRHRGAVDEERSVDVGFHEFLADDESVLRQVYDRAGQPLDERSWAAIDHYRRAHPRGRHGRVDYRLADLGVDEAARREALRFYVDRFGVQIESLPG